jgi:hypothetical protein
MRKIWFAIASIASIEQWTLSVNQEDCPTTPLTRATPHFSAKNTHLEVPFGVSHLLEITPLQGIINGAIFGSL